MTGCYVVEYLLNALKEEPDFYAGMEIILVPISNPDGFAYSATSSRFWRKNRRDNPGRCDGVDINRNWGPDWNGGESTSTNPCSDVYVGSGAQSEPESQALAKLVEEAPVLVHVDIHCYSELILGPWGYTRRNHPEKPQVDELGLAMQAGIKEVHSKTYKYGTGGANIYLASGCFSDWTTSKGAYGYTYELRPTSGGLRGFAPPPNQILPSAEEAIQGLYVAIDWAKDKGTPVPPPAPPPAPTPAPTPPPKPDVRRRSPTKAPPTSKPDPLFGRMDQNKDGCIDSKELRLAIQKGVVKAPEQPTGRRRRGASSRRRRRTSSGRRRTPRRRSTGRRRSSQEAPTGSSSQEPSGDPVSGFRPE